MHSPITELPPAFLEKLSLLLDETQLEQVLNSFSVDKPTTFRINTLKGSIQDTTDELRSAQFNLTPVSWLPTAFHIPPDQRRALTETDAFYQGRIYIQNLSSMVAPFLLAPQPGETVLDLAAAPGGKTLQIAAMMENQGRLSAVEAVKNRFFKLKANLDQQGASMVKTYLADGRSVGNKCPEMFDRVLLDAPCSSEARFSLRDASSWEHWSTRKVSEVAHKQKRLLQSALTSLKVGGVMIYCTCSFSPEENEHVVNHLLKKYNSCVSLEPIELPFSNTMAGITHWQNKTYADALTHSRRILPDNIMDGFFICKLRKHTSC
ncbi:RsmB/NOP family class I SAM-dependent RNA methyltransferase [Zooshikella sp. RANM57]|uniref:RsmB/NOP family class I SAM-dependent RNA methyltransferase n=1 Tax=Zooshikella sp. RANM57 TaxID=3425863 RepID=UPI003D6F9093